MIRRPPRSTLFPYTRSSDLVPSRSGTASGIASTPVIFTRGLRAPSASSECRRDLAEEALELALLVPGGEAERHVADTRVEVRAELGDTLARAPGDGPLLDELSCELRGVVGVEDCLRLREGPLGVLVDVDVVVERAPERRGVAPLLPRHRSDSRELRPKLRRRGFVRHPAVGVAGDAAIGALHRDLRGAGAALPGEARRVRRDPDGARALHRPRLERDVLERVEAAVVRRVRLVEELTEDDDTLFEAPHPLARADAHHGVLRRLRGSRS